MAKKTIIASINVQGTEEQERAMAKLGQQIDATTRELKEYQQMVRKGISLSETESRRRAQLENDIKAQKNAYRDLQAEILKSNDALRKQSGFVAGVKKGMEQAMATVAKLVVAYQAMRGAIEVVNRVNQSAIQIIRDRRKSEIVFGQELFRVTKRANEMAQALGLTRREYISATASTQDLLVPLGLSRQAAADMSLQLTELAGAATLWDAQQRDAVEIASIFTKAMLGEAEQAKTLGIVINQSTKEFRDAVKAQMEQGDVTAEQAKALAIFNMIQEKTTDLQSSFAESADDLGLKQSQANAQLREAQDLLAMQLTPAITDATAAYAEFIGGLAQGLQIWNQQTFAVSDATQMLRQTLSGTRTEALEFIRSIQDEDEANKAALATLEQRRQEISRQVDAGEITLAQGRALTDALFNEKVNREQANETYRQYFQLIVANESALRDLTDAVDENADANKKSQEELDKEALKRLSVMIKTREQREELERLNDELDAYLRKSLSDDDTDIMSALFPDDARREISQDAMFAADALFDDSADDQIVDRWVALFTKVTDEAKKAADEMDDAWTSATQGVIDTTITAFGDIANRAAQNRVDRAERTAQIEQDVLRAQLQNNLITEEQFRQRSEQIQRQQLQARKRAALASVFIDGAVGAAKILATYPPPTNIPFLAEHAVKVLAQAAIVSAQQFADGGFTNDTKRMGRKDSTGYRVAGVVHENEYVVPERVLKSKRGRAMVEALESMRRGRAHMKHDLTDKAIQVIQHSDGSFTDANIVDELKRGRKTAEHANRELRKTIERKTAPYYG